ECYQGHDYRVLVAGGRVVAAAERVPARVVGDGRHTVAQLIDIANTDPRRGDGHENQLTKIVIDAALLTCLARRGSGLEVVPAAGETVLLRETANLSTGGTARDVTDEIHPAVAAACRRAARAVGLDVCGVDLILPDVAAPLPESGGGVIEVNAAPGIRMHRFPGEGKPRDAGAAIVDMLYPADVPSRVPVVSVTGTNGKTTVTRMIGAAVAAAGKVAGMTTSDGIVIGGESVAEGDMTGFHSA